MEFFNFGLVWFLGFLPFFLRNIVPPETYEWLNQHKDAILERFSRYYKIRIDAESESGLGSDQLYSSVHRYLAEVAQSTKLAKSMIGSCPKGSEEVHFTLAPNQMLEDVYKGRTIKWMHSFDEGDKDEYGCKGPPKKAYEVTLKKTDRGILKEYLNSILHKGTEMVRHERQKKLYTNSSYGYWMSTPFQSPATLNTVAMELEKKEALIQDLKAFKTGKDYYRKVGRAWKRGYLLYGPPGTGKSSLIAAIANFTKYDVYDLELTSVKDNADLRRLLIDIKDRAIVVVEDIDCSLELKNRAEKHAAKSNKAVVPTDQQNGKVTKTKTTKNVKKKEGITLSGFLNFTDGLWSSCGKERIFIFTTNYKDKLDPALLRSGRMDYKIEMSYCSFEVFKALASTYLGISDHDLYHEIEELIPSVKISPADTIEVLLGSCFDPTTALKKLLAVLKQKIQSQEQERPSIASDDSSSSSSDDE